MSGGEKPCPVAVGARIGAYEILDRVASGEWGCLYRARRGARSYALHLARYRFSDLRAGNRRSERERVEREFAALKSFRHPNIVRAHSLECWPDPESGHPCLVTDLVEGEPLGGWCARKKPSALEVAQVFERIARAVEYMHRRGAVHRDLSGDRIIVAEGDNPVVAGFGIAELRPEVRRGVAGKAGRRSPDLARYRRADTRRGEPLEQGQAADLCALGVMLYEALCGKRPFPAAADLAADRKRPRSKRCRPARPSEKNPLVPPALDELALRLLERDPRRRPESAGEVAKALARAREGADDLRAKGAEGSADTLGPLPSPPQLASEPVAASFDAPTLGGLPPFDSGTAREALPLGSARHEGPDKTPTAIRLVKARLAAAAPQKARKPFLVAIGAASLLVGTVLAALVFGGPKAAARPAAAWGPARGPVPGAQSSSGVLAEPDYAADWHGSSRRTDEFAVDEELEREFGRPTVMPDGGIVPRAPAVSTGAPATTTGEGAWLKRSDRREPAKPAGVASRLRGVPLGFHIRARLLTNLDSRTIGNGPVEAVLPRAAVARSGVVLPEGTLVFGSAAESNGRFTVRFTRMRLPDDSEVAFDGIAIAREDGKPGLPAATGIDRAVERGGSTVLQVAKEPANAFLDSLASPVQTLARSLGEKVFDRGSSSSAGPGRTLLLDAGVVFDIWVEKAF